MSASDELLKAIAVNAAKLERRAKPITEGGWGWRGMHQGEVSGGEYLRQNREAELALEKAMSYNRKNKDAPVNIEKMLELRRAHEHQFANQMERGGWLETSTPIRIANDFAGLENLDVPREYTGGLLRLAKRDFEMWNNNTAPRSVLDNHRWRLQIMPDLSHGERMGIINGTPGWDPYASNDDFLEMVKMGVFG